MQAQHGSNFQARDKDCPWQFDLHSLLRKHMSMAKLSRIGLIGRSVLLTESSEWAAKVEQVSRGAIKAVLLPEEGPPLLRTVLEMAEVGVPGLMSGYGFAGFMNISVRFAQFCILLSVSGKHLGR